jgi:hypothetical protein
VSLFGGTKIGGLEDEYEYEPNPEAASQTEAEYNLMKIEIDWRILRSSLEFQKAWNQPNAIRNGRISPYLT